MNSKTPWTPGPWQRSLACEMKGKSPPYNVWTIIGNTAEDERKHSVVATTITDDNDARLIAATPEMAEFVKSVFLWDLSKNIGRKKSAPLYPHIVEQSKALLAKLGI